MKEMWWLVFYKRRIVCMDERRDGMKKDIHFSSRMLTLAGGLLAVSGILMAICAKLAIGGIFWAAAACMFFSACHFRIAEDKKEKEEEKKNEKETI